MLKMFRERATWNGLRKTESGQVAVIFALSLVPILAIAGFAIDFQNTTTRKLQVQSAVDTAVIAGARAMQAGKTEAEIKDEMGAYITAMADTHQNSLTCSEPQITFPDGTKDIAVKVRCTQKTIVSQVIGKDKIDFDVGATSTWGVGKLDVAFMFDVSGSMGWDNRMTHLKAAAQDALDTLLPAGGGVGTDEVRIAMVSYNDMVNAGDYFEEVTGLKPRRTYYAMDTRNEWVEEETTTTEWQRVEEEYETTQWQWVKERTRVCKRWNRKGKCTKYKWQNEWVYKEVTTTATRWVWEEVEVTDTEWVEKEVQVEVSKEINSTCVWERYGDHDFDGTSPYGKETTYNGQTPPSPVDKIYNATTKIYNASVDPDDNPEGYLSAAYAVFNDNGNSDGSWSVSGETSCSNHKPIGLSRNRTQLEGYIRGLSTGGGTAGHQGIAWSWALVAEEWQNIFTGSAKPLDYDEPDSVKAVILMTDGDFLHQHFGGQGNSVEQAKKVCDAMKDSDGILIYTVAFQAPDQGKAILSYCASEEEFAFSPENGEELSQAYQAIATSISDLRIKF